MNLGFIGVGKIATAVIEGLCTSKIENTNIFLSPRNSDNADYLVGKYPNVAKLNSNQAVLDRSEIIFIALRPSDAIDALRTCRFAQSHTVVSFIALIRHEAIAKVVHPAAHVSRAIPLPPVRYHNCPIPILYPTQAVTQIMSHLGQPFPMTDEEQLHLIWALSGLIAPYYDLLNTLGSWSTAHGVEKELANRYIADMFQSLSYLAQRANPLDFAELAKHAATAKGMNEQASKEIREKGALEIYRVACENILKRFG